MRHANGYSIPARLFHWVVALLVFGMIPAGLIMVREVPRPLQDALFIFHKNTGVVVLVIMVARALYRLAHPPAPLPPLPEWQRRVAGATHAALYVLAIAMPITGYVRVRAGGFPVEALDRLGVPKLVPKSEALANAAEAAHYYLAWTLIAVLALHVAAALRHALRRGDGVFVRMWPPLG